MTGPGINEREAIRAWLMNYAWISTDPAVKAREVDCIMSQDDWQHIDAVADQFAGAQFEPGQQAWDEGQEFALSALYECHSGPHTADCPFRDLSEDR